MSDTFAVAPNHAVLTHDDAPTKSPLPELLCPVGSPLALDAAIEGGADALYLGGSAFNARMNAANFDAQQLSDAIQTAHAYGVKVYLTMNTLLYDRERKDFLRAVEQAAAYGVDALIVADLGGAADIHAHFPTLPLHASTQMSAHNADAGQRLADLGFCRMVVARELCQEDLCRIVKRSPIEIEAFVHGALCVCHSGQCLFSSLVGGRSGNRGECAQPCRLPYRALGSSKDSYPLSLKDLSLAAHVPALIESGIASLKIEGRMKAPSYVWNVTRIWRRLLDERRAANEDEMRELAEVFSRGGLTDGYFTRRINRQMLGIRSAQDKALSEKAMPSVSKISKTLPLDVCITVKQDEPMLVRARVGNRTASVQGAVPEPAKTAPTTKDLILRQFGKLGGTPYALRDCQIELDEGLMLPVSALNQLRRDLVNALIEQGQPSYPSAQPAPIPLPDISPLRSEKSARFARAEQVTPQALAAFDLCYLPLHLLLRAPTLIKQAEEQGKPLGVLLPEVITECEMPVIESMLDQAVALGVRRAMVGNLGHLRLAQAKGLTVDGDFRFNLTNSHSAALLHGMGLATLMASPEMTLPQIRDLRGAIRTVVYGRIPLMILEKCATHELYSCKSCDAGTAVLVDRRGTQFPLGRAYDHRTLIYNSAPTYMADKQQLLAQYHIGGQHFIFTVESPSEVNSVLHAYQKGTPAAFPIRRIGV